METVIGLMIVGVVIGSGIKVWHAPYTPTIWDKAGVNKQTYRAKVKSFPSNSRSVELE